MKTKHYLLSILALSLIGCAGNGWKQYTEAKTCYMKNEANCDAIYKDAIEIRSDLPGLHSSYGTWLMRENRTQEAQVQFEIERANYPMASFALDRALNKKSIAETPAAAVNVTAVVVDSVVPAKKTKKN